MNGAALLDHTVERVIAPVDAIVLAAQEGSPAAFAELHSIYSVRLYKTILAITRNPHDAEEALQETFLRAYLAIKTFEGKSKVYSWLTRIAINSALMILRTRRARPEVLFDPQPDDRYETIFFEPRDPAPNPEQAYDLCQRQITPSVDSSPPSFTTSANSDADEARVATEGNQPGAEYLRSGCQVSSISRTSTAFHLAWRFESRY